MDSLPPEQQVGILNTIRSVDDKSYQSVMDQVAKNKPAVAYAGVIAGSKQVPQLDKSSLGGGWFSSPTMPQLTPSDAAATMLSGQQLISNTKKDGKFAIPPDSGPNGLRNAWASAVGNAFQGDGEGEANAYQAYRAMYAGLSEKYGKNDGAYDERIAQQAVAYTIGHPVGWNTGTVIPPYGMDENTFRDAVDASWQKVRPQIKGRENESVEGYDLTRVGDGFYLLSSGTKPVVNNKGGRVVLQIDPNASNEPITHWWAK